MTKITATAATEAGALAGFEIECVACGVVGRSSLETLAAADAQRHAEWHERRAASCDECGDRCATVVVRANGESLCDYCCSPANAVAVSS